MTYPPPTTGMPRTNRSVEPAASLSVQLAEVFLVLILSTGICELIAGALHPINLILIYLAAVVVMALRRGRWASILTLIGSVLIFDWIFVQPRWSLKPTDPQYFFTFAVALTVGLIVSHLTTRAREAAIQARDEAARADILSQFALSLNELDSGSAIADRLAAEVRQTLGIACTALPWPAPTEPGQLPFCLPIAGGSAIGLQQPPEQLRDARDSALLTGLVHQARLATQRVTAETKAREVALRAEAERLRNTLLAGISHDFRTPLTTIIGAASSLREQGDQLSQPQRAQLLDHIEDQARRLQSISSDLLAWARLQDESVDIEPEWCPAGELVREAIAQVGDRLEPDDLLLALNENDVLWCDARLMAQAVSNLLINAIEHGGDHPCIEVRVETDEAGWALSVRDQGPGLSEVDLANAFNRFYRGEGRRKDQGTGLGLAICAAVVQLHGGQIRAHNDHGAVFTLSFAWPAAGRPASDRLMEAE